MKTIELHNAYQWDCDECGTENFNRAIAVALTAEDKAEMQARYGGDFQDWQEGDWMTRPNHVICKACGAKFETTDHEGPHKERMDGPIIDDDGD